MSLYTVLPEFTEFYISYKVGNGKRIVKRFYVKVVNEIDNFTKRMYCIYGEEFDYMFLP